jgi:outer membrane murein-binding lipoprotein Lpp
MAAQTLNAKFDDLESRVKQLERDIAYLLSAVAALSARIAAVDDRERLREAKQMRGVR